MRNQIVKTFVLWVSLVCLLGCSTTLREKAATESDTGNATELKLTGPKVKVVHSF